MLVLSRKPGEKVVIDGGITVRVMGIIGNRVRLAFDAPEDVRILRAELATWEEWSEDGGQPAESTHPREEEAYRFPSHARARCAVRARSSPRSR